MRWDGIWRQWGNEKDFEDKAEKESEEIIIMNEGRTISLKELLHYILLRWRSLIVYVVVFAVAFGGFGAFKAYKDAKTAVEQEQNPDLTQYENELKESEIQEVKDAVEDYISYGQTYKNYKDYINNSIKMQLNANKVSTQKIVYQISGDAELKSIADTYMELFPNNTVYEEIMKQVDWKVEPSYIGELISMSNSHMESISFGGQSVSSVMENNAEENDPIVLSIQILADNQENCELMGNVIETEFEKCTTKLQNKFGAFRIEKIDESYSEEANKNLLSEQQNCINEMNTVSNVMKNIETTLTDQQKTYFLELLNSSDKELVTESEMSSSSKMNNIDYLNIKYMILGAGVGFFLFAFYAMCRFLFNKHFLSSNYVKVDLERPVLETFIVSNKKKKIGNRIDSFIDRLFIQRNDSFSREDKLQMLCTNVKVFMKKNNMRSVYLTGSVQTAEVTEFIKEIKKGFDEENITNAVGKPILYDADSLEKFSERDGVVFIEQLGKSLNDEICEELYYCEKYGVQNIGFVVLE